MFLGTRIGIPMMGGASAPVAEPFAVTHSGIAQEASGVASRSMNFGFTATAGRLLLLIVCPDKASSVTTPAGWTPVGTAHSAGTGISGAMFCNVASGGETGVSYSIGAATSNTTVGVVEFSGPAASPIDQTVTSTVNTSIATQRSTGAMTTGATDTAGEIAVAVFANDNASTAQGGTFVWTNGFTTLASLGVGAAAPVTTAPAMVIGTATLGAAGGTASTTGSYTGGTADEAIGFVATVRPA